MKIYWVIVICRRPIPPICLHREDQETMTKPRTVSPLTSRTSSFSSLGHRTSSAKTKTILSKPGQPFILQNVSLMEQLVWVQLCCSELRQNKFLKHHFPWKEIRALFKEIANSRCERNCEYAKWTWNILLYQIQENSQRLEGSYQKD